MFVTIDKIATVVDLGISELEEKYTFLDKIATSGRVRKIRNRRLVHPHRQKYNHW